MKGHSGGHPSSASSGGCERTGGAIAWLTAAFAAGCAAACWLDARVGADAADGWIDASLVLAPLSILAGRLAGRWRIGASAAIFFVALAWAFLDWRFTLQGDSMQRVPRQKTLVCVIGIAASDPVIHRVEKGRRPLIPGSDLLAAFAHDQSHGSMRLEASEIEGAAGVREPLEGELRVRWSGAVSPCRAGDLVRVRGWLAPPQAARNPGSFDGRRWAARQGILGTLECDSAELIEVLPPPPDLSIRLRAGQLAAREAFARGLAASLPAWTDPSVRELLVAMTIGVRGETIPSIRGLFARVGLSHFIAISGFNLAVLFGAVVAVARLLGVPRRWSGGLLLVVSLLFLFVIEAEVSVVRAGLAGIAAGTAMLFDRAWPRLNVFAAVTLCVLIADPGAVSEPAFQLSFGVVLGLMTLADRVSRWTASLAMRALPWRFTPPVATAVGTSLTAWVVASPIALFQFGTLSPWAVLWSVVLSPLAALLAILGPPAALLGTFAPGAAIVFGWPLAITGSVFFRTVVWAEQLPGSIARAPSPSCWWLLGELALLGATVLGPRRGVRLAAAGAWLTLSTLPWWPGGTPDFEVISLDVGDGAAHLVRTRDACLLVDAGSLGQAAAGSRVIVPALSYLGVHRLDCVIVTQNSVHHFGALPEVVAALPVDQLIVPQSILSAPRWSAAARLLQAARSRAIPISEGSRGVSIDLGGTRVSILHPGDTAFRDGRDSGLAVRVQGRDPAFSALFLGDLGAAGLAALAQEGLDPAPIVELPRHGAAVAGLPALLHAADARVLIQSCGRRRAGSAKFAASTESSRLACTGRSGAIRVTPAGGEGDGSRAWRVEHWTRAGWSGLDGRGAGGDGRGAGSDGPDSGLGGDDEGPFEDDAILDRAAAGVLDLELERRSVSLDADIGAHVIAIEEPLEEFLPSAPDRQLEAAVLAPVSRERHGRGKSGGSREGKRQKPRAVEGDGR